MTAMTNSEVLAVLDVLVEREFLWSRPESAQKIKEARAHIADALRDREWWPIESAPKDRPVLLAAFHVTDEQGGPSVWSGRWDDFMEYFRTCNDYCPIWDATHWQPLPEPPK